MRVHKSNSPSPPLLFRLADQQMNELLKAVQILSTENKQLRDDLVQSKQFIQQLLLQDTHKQFQGR